MNIVLGWKLPVFDPLRSELKHREAELSCMNMFVWPIKRIQSLLRPILDLPENHFCLLCPQLTYAWLVEIQAI
jgi:hypothetical protein